MNLKRDASTADNRAREDIECCVGTHPKILTKGIELPFYIGIHPDSNRCLSYNKKIIYVNISYLIAKCNIDAIIGALC